MFSNKSILKRYSSIISVAVRIADGMLVWLSAYIAFYIKFSSFNILSRNNYSEMVLIATLLVVICFPLFDIYRSWRGQDLFRLFGKILLGWGTVIIALLVMAYTLKISESISRIWLFLWALSFIFSAVFLRVVEFSFLRYIRKRGWNRRRIIIIGAGKTGRELANRISHLPDTGYDVTGYLDDDESLLGREFNNAKVLGSTNKVLANTLELEIDEVWLALPLNAEIKVRKVIHDLRNTTVTIRYVPDIFTFSLTNHSVTEIAGMPMFDISASPMTGVNWLIKMLEDKLFASFILLLISPVMICIALVVKLTSKGPVLYKQERVSWNGKSFMMLKFRTMPVNTESESGPVWASKGDARATKVGKFLRATSLDELPQFINVLKGDMSIVGPRPERPLFVEKYKDEVPNYMKKHLVKAGITGWAQVNGFRGNTDLNKRIQLDLYYIENWSFWLDFKIILLTLKHGFINENAY